MPAGPSKLKGISTEEVISLLIEETDGKAIKRLVAAREYLAGNSPAAISEKYGWPEQTIYSWFDRIEDVGLADAIHDNKPPGRPDRLSHDAMEQFGAVLEKPPDEVGFEGSEWTGATAQRYLERDLDTHYSRRHARRLIKRARSEYSDRGTST